MSAAPRDPSAPFVLLEANLARSCPHKEINHSSWVHQVGGVCKTLSSGQEGGMFAISCPSSGREASCRFLWFGEGRGEIANSHVIISLPK